MPRIARSALFGCLLVMTLTSEAQPPDPFPAGFGGPGKPGGAVAVLREGRVVWSRCVGLADLDAGTPIDARTNFRLASVSKQFTAVATLRLVERGELRLNTTLDQLWPDLPPWAGTVTVEHLLTHTSGLPEYYDVAREDTPLTDGDQLRDADVLTILRGVDRLDFEPGSRYRYNNAGYALLALIVEARSGQTFSEFLDAELFTPLGMLGSVAYVRGVHEVPWRAFGHTVRDDGSIARTDQSRFSAVLGDGGVYASLEDLARWCHALEQGRVLSAELLAQAQRAYPLSDGSPSDYGFGWRTSDRNGRRCVWHSGSTVGFRTALHTYPDHGFAVVVLLNRQGGDQPDAGDLADAVAATVLAQDLSER